MAFCDSLVERVSARPDVEACRADFDSTSFVQHRMATPGYFAGMPFRATRVDPMVALRHE